MNRTNFTILFENTSLISDSVLNPCPRQRSVTRPLLFVHNYALFFFGAIFNFLAFAILVQRSLRCHSTFAYLAFLSLSNGLLSLVHFSKWMFQYYLNIFLESILLTCRFHRFSLDFLTHFSLFTLVCVNIDRARTVTKNRPNRKYPKSKFRLVLFKEFLIGSILCAFHFHWMLKYGYEVLDGATKTAICDFNDNETESIYYFLLTRVYPPFELGVFFGLPLLINIVCTILIVRSLSVRMRTAKQFHSTKINLTDQTLPSKSRRILSYFLPRTTSTSNILSCLCFQMQCRRHTRLRLKVGRNDRSLNKYEEENQTNERQKSITLSTASAHDIQSQLTLKTTTNLLNRKHRAKRARDLHLSAMLIGLNILYLILNIPFNFHQTFVKHFHKNNSDPCNIMFVSLLLDALQQTFFSTNFFLYVLTNRRFREEFYNTMTTLLSHCKQSTPRESLTHIQHHKSQPRISSCNPSTNIHTNQTSDNQMMPVLTNHYRDSIISNIEVTENIPSQKEQSVLVLTNENNKFPSKLVMFRNSPDD